MEHVKNLNKDSENLDVIVKGTVTGKSMNSQDEVLYQIETPCGDCFEAEERCVYHDATKPVEVHQYVANWYEINKFDLEYNIWSYIFNWKYQSDTSFKTWMNNAGNKPIQTLITMHQFGYKVKEDKKYIVKMVGLFNNLGYLNYDSMDDEWYFNDADNGFAVRTHHTKKQLEDAGFSNVFDNPMFEVKEVE